MKKNFIIFISAICIFVVALIFFVYTNFSNQNKVEEDLIKEGNDILNNEDPYVESQTKDIDNVSYTDFTIYDENNSEIKLSEFKDKPTMLLFFNPDNEDSMTVLKKVEDIYKNFEDGVEFLMINTSQNIDKDLSKEYTLKIYYDFYKEASRNYNITELPSMIFINKDNEVFNAKSGVISADALDANLTILMENY